MDAGTHPGAGQFYSRLLVSLSEYASDTSGAWYTMIESLNKFTDKGDSRFDVAAGILYEARRWACEASLRLPLKQDWPHQEDYRLTVGIRYLP